MPLFLRDWLMLAAALAAFAMAAPAPAQTWPEKPVRLVVAFAPGGLIDIFARTLQPRLAEGLAQPVIIENRGGAGGTLAEAVVAKSAPPRCRPGSRNSEPTPS